MKRVCVLNFELQTLEIKKIIISLLKCYVHQLQGPGVTINLHGHLLPDGGHIVFRPLERIPGGRQELNDLQSMNTTVPPAINHMNNH